MRELAPPSRRANPFNEKLIPLVNGLIPLIRLLIPLVVGLVPLVKRLIPLVKGLVVSRPGPTMPSSVESFVQPADALPVAILRFAPPVAAGIVAEQALRKRRRKTSWGQLQIT